MFLVRAALEASPPRDLSLRRDIREQTPSGRITRLIAARRRAAQRPRRSPPPGPAGCRKEGGGFRHQLRASTRPDYDARVPATTARFFSVSVPTLVSTGTSATHATSGSETQRRWLRIGLDCHCG